MPDWLRYEVSVPLWGLLIILFVGGAAGAYFGIGHILLGAGALIVIIAGGTFLLPRLLRRG